MQPLTRLFIKTGLIYFLVGTVLAFLSEWQVLGLRGLLLPVYWHMLVMGWICQIIMGVAFWLFPRKYRDRPEREAFLTKATYVTLNTGLLMRFITEPFISLVTDTSLITIVLILSSLLQVAAIVLFMAEIWPRLFHKKSRRKPAGAP